MSMDQSNKDDGKKTKEKSSGGKFYIKARYVFGVMGFLAHFNLYMLRNSINVAIVAMVNQTEVLVGNETANSSYDQCPDREQSNSAQTAKEGTFQWDSIEQGLVLGCYFYGYIVSNIPGAWLSRKFGFKVVIGIAHAVGSILTLLMPVASYASFELLVTMRVVLGLFQGVVCASYAGGVGVWSPQLERTTLFTMGLSGSSMGTVVVFPIAGLITDNLGWEAVFYITGGFVLAWTVLWFFLIYDSPEEHPRISETEKTFILQTRGAEKTTKSIKVPWKDIFLTPCVYAIIIGHFASNWGNYTLMSMLPTYMATVLKFDLSTSGILSSVPYICQLVFTLFGGWLTDFILRKGLLKVIWMRKINTILGLAVPALFVIIAGYIGCNATLAVVFFSISTGLTGFAVAGCKGNPNDIAPRYSGILYAISNTVANISGFAAPQAVGVLLSSGNTLSNWQNVFWISASVYLAGTLVFLILGSGDEQEWAKEKPQKYLEGKDNLTDMDLKHEKSRRL